jgi:lauroyl/myristoyl acyltransferase
MRAIRSRDLVDLTTLFGLLPIAWLLPTRRWPTITRWIGHLHVRLLGSSADHLADVLRRQLDLNPIDLEIGFRQHNYWELLEILREHAPWRWKVNIAVVGQHHLDAALAAGRGAVLWYCPFTHADVVFKKGLYGAGYRVNHLSSLTHGFSDTRFGVSLLNPIKTSVERRYLKERCVMRQTGVGDVIRSLLDRLRANELVSVTALQTGKRIGSRPLFGGTLRLAKGAPNFALTTNAALIPVFVVPAGDGYEVRVEPPLQASSSALESAEEELISAYVPILERYVREHSDLWRGWLGSPNYWSLGQ